MTPLPAITPTPTPVGQGFVDASATTLAVIADGLASPDWMVRLTATDALGCLHGPDVVPWLERRLADVEPDVRAAALTALSQRPEPRARTLLLSVQDDSTEELSLRVLAASAVARPVNPCD